MGNKGGFIADKMKKFKLNDIFANVKHFSSKENVEKIDRTWIDNLWSIIVLPERSAEIESWVENNKTSALMLTGVKCEETLLHWSVLSTISLTMCLYNVGISINSKDKDGKTPFDWLIERYNVVFVNKLKTLNKDGESRMKSETQSMGTYIWNIGARPGSSLDDIKSGKDMSVISCIADGQMWLIKVMYETYGASVLKNWMDNGRSLMHVWLLTPTGPEKEIGFKTLMSDLKLRDNILKNAKDKKMLSVDEKDADGRTPLWYCISMLEDISEDDGVSFIIDNITILKKLGANIHIKDIYGVSPYDLLMKNVNHKNFDYINVLFKENSKVS